MCGCIERVNGFLKEHNTKLELPMIGPQQLFVTTIKIDDKKRGKPRAMFASCCPFCGEEYPEYKSPFKKASQE